MFKIIKITISVIFILLNVFFSLAQNEENAIIFDLKKTISNQEPKSNVTKSELENLIIKLTNVSSTDTFSFSGVSFIDQNGLIELSKNHNSEKKEFIFYLKNLKFVKDLYKEPLKYKITWKGSIKPAIFESSDSFEGVLKVVEDKSIPEINTQSKIPIPVFNYYPDDSLLKTNKKNRCLIIDATPNPMQKINNSLYKIEGDNQVNVNGIHVNSSITVLIRNYSFNNIKEASVNINGTDYSYRHDLSSLYKQVTLKPDEVRLVSLDTISREDIIRIEDYLNEVLKSLDLNRYLNINDLYRLEAYKDTLKKTIDTLKNGLSVQEEIVLSQILSWFPEYVSLTPIALTAPDTDEIEIKVSLQHKGENKAKEYNVGTYRTSGGLAIAVNSSLFITGLKNNKVYTDSLDVDGTNELRAKINEDCKQYSIGIGLNSEVSFRTGYIVRPTINVGFFIPFEEDISPYFALGPGISIGTKKVKFSLTGGLAFGKVNAIAEQYSGKDLSQFANLTNESLTEKVWKCGWQFGIGVSFNLPGN